MSLTLGESQRAQSVASFGRIYERSGGASLALTYRFLGRLSAPGLIEPLRTPATIGS
jgi:hypothetical protein